MYLVLGPPLSGKTSLLRAIAGNLPQGKFNKKQRPDAGEGLAHLTGRVLYNNLVAAGDDADGGLKTLVKNLGAFVRQTDSHAPRLTVGENSEKFVILVPVQMSTLLVNFEKPPL